MDPLSDALPPDADRIAAMAAATRDALPEPYRAAAREVALRVEDFAADEILDDMEIESAFELSGLYDGTPLTLKSTADQPGQPDAIWLFRRPILDEWAERESVTLGELVAHVYLHELAHHFGWSDDDIARVAPWD
ncbi:MAG: metallopeptidase family protein [Shimia sp.]